MSLFNYKRFSGGMAEGGGPYVVDTHASSRPPLPPRLHRRRSRGEVAQTLLFLLVSLALCCVVIEGCFIYYLHQSHRSDEAGLPVHSKLIADGNVTSPAKRPKKDHPSKPVAHLTDALDVVHDQHIMAWSTVAEPLLYQMGYKDRSLIIQKDGYYYVYSKVHFSDSEAFAHYVERRTKKYPGGNLTLLQSRNYSPKSENARSNSFLGGVFHLEKSDAIHVRVSSTKKVPGGKLCG